MDNSGRVGQDRLQCWICLGKTSAETGWRRETLAEEKINVYVVQIAGGRYAYAHASAAGVTNQSSGARLASIEKGLIAPGFKTGLPELYGGVNVNKAVWSLVSERRVTEEEVNAADDLKSRSAISGEHHIHLLPSEVLKSCKDNTRRRMSYAAMRLAACLSDATQTTVATFGLYAACAKREIVVIWMSMLLWHAPRTARAYITCAKLMTQRAKQLQHSMELDLVQIFETEVLVNRGVGEVSWADEQKNRTEAVTVPIPPDAVRSRAAAIFSDGKARRKRRYMSQSWNQWWETRWLHVPGGSVHPRLDHLKQMRTDLKKEAGLSKKTFVSAMEKLEFEQVKSIRPGIRAYPSEKYEWGKRRAIYGTDLEGFMMADLAMPQVEQLLPVYTVTGSDASDDYVRRIMRQYGSGMVPFCFDYEDFNSQHSAESMRQTLLGFMDVYEAEMSPEQREAMRWTANSVNDMWVMPNGTLGVKGYKAEHTLLSGWRLTTVVNSVLNRIYLDWSGALEHTTASLHSGDDVFSATTSLYSCYKFMEATRKHGIRAQPVKAAMSSIAEFLRIDHKGEEKGSQYLPRACSTYTHSRPESREAMSYVSWLGSIKTRGGELLDRGAEPDVVTAANALQAEHASRRYGLDYTLIDKAYSLHPTEGGLCRSAQLTGCRLREVSSPGEAVSKLAEAARPGARDVANWLAKQLELGRNEIGKMTELIVKTTSRSITRVRRRVELENYFVTFDMERRHLLNGMYRSHAKGASTAVYKGVDIKLATTAAIKLGGPLCNAIKRSKDPIADFQLLT